MNFLDKKWLSPFIILFVISQVMIGGVWAEEEEKKETVELIGDSVEFSTDGNVMIAEGKVVMKHSSATLYCDQVEYYRDTQVAIARGHVRLVSKEGEISGDQVTFNFGSMTGVFNNARITSDPYYGAARTVSKVSETRILMTDGYITTSDFDNPEYRLKSKKIEIYPGDKLVARGSRLLFGKIPTIYIPWFSQSLKEEKPRIIFTPGYTKKWGIFLLSQTRLYLTENIKGMLHVDYREKLDLAEGIDIEYTTPSFGSGTTKLYYTNERRISSKRLFQEQPTPTIERERFKAEWRHKWDIDDKTTAIAQYYKLSDSTFLEEFFKKENKLDPNPDTFFFLTKVFKNGVLSFRTEARVNRFETKVERLPELKYTLSSTEILKTGLFISNTSSFVNLTRKTAAPSEARKKAKRIDSESILSYPMKVGFVEFKPFVGGRNTYYSRTTDPEKYNSIRGLFTTGASFSTKFYKIMDVKVDKWGLEINRLRHIITPTISYKFTTEPTLVDAQIDQFDGVDSLVQNHSIVFGIENKLQTKRNKVAVDLLRFLLTTDFRLKEDSSQGGFNKINLDIDFIPTGWLSLFVDAQYDTRKDRLRTANFDLYINGKDKKWSFAVGKRLEVDADDQITTQIKYKINPKWLFRTYGRFDVETGVFKEQEYTLRRDLHSWYMDINFNERRNQGNEIWIVFTLKAFPDMTLDLGTRFNRRKAGSQSP